MAFRVAQQARFWAVIPAKAGIHFDVGVIEACRIKMDPGFRRDDEILAADDEFRASESDSSLGRNA